ncbi:hypothetical protein V2J09_020347 [Rumex salicifolius]
MALDAISSNDILNFMIYEKLYGNPLKHDHSILDHPSLSGISCSSSILPSQDDMMVPPSFCHGKCEDYCNERDPNLATQQGRKKRRRRTRVCKNKEEVELQRMTHIAVERNRRKQMNDHLSVLRSLMPSSYVQKELEHFYQSLQAKKFTLLNQGGGGEPTTTSAATTTNNTGKEIEATLMESHANLRILSKRNPLQLSKLIAGLQLLHMSILHLSVTSMDTLVLYSINAKVEEGCRLTSVHEIVEATSHMLRSIEEEVALC